MDPRTFGALAAALFVVLGPLQSLFGFVPLPLPVMAGLVAITVAYVAASEITRSISIINEIAQANADGAGQIADGARSLDGVAETLKGKVTSF